MTNILVLQGHPDATEPHLCHAIADSYCAAAMSAGHDVRVMAIAEEDIPFVRSKTDWEGEDLPEFARIAQDAVLAADHIVLIYPLWMGDVPAIVKAWLEQVFRQGFAFKMTNKSWKPALKGKSARVIVTMGMPGFVYRWFYFAHGLRNLDRNILKFCGIRPVKWSIFGNAEDPSGKAQAQFLETAKRLGLNAA